jgi:hypothetical protein
MNFRGCRSYSTVCRWLVGNLLLVGLVSCGSIGSAPPNSSAAVSSVSNVISPSLDYLSELHPKIERGDKLTCVETSTGNWCGPSKLHGTLLDIGIYKRDPFFVSGEVFGGEPLSVVDTDSSTERYRLAVLESVFVISSVQPSATGAHLSLNIRLGSGTVVSCPLAFGHTPPDKCEPS